MSIWKHLLDGAANMGKLAAVNAAHNQMASDAKKAARRGGDTSGSAIGETCTPCAAAAKGTEMANTIWK